MISCSAELGQSIWLRNSGAEGQSVRTPPAAFVVEGELEIVPLTRHADRDPSETKPNATTRTSAPANGTVRGAAALFNATMAECCRGQSLFVAPDPELRGSSWGEVRPTPSREVHRAVWQLWTTIKVLQPHLDIIDGVLIPGVFDQVRDAFREGHRIILSLLLRWPYTAQGAGMRTPRPRAPGRW